MSDENNPLDDAKESAKEFAEEAKETAKEFTDSARETFQSTDNKKILAGILGILLGAFGVHKFILGYNKEGIIMLAATIVLGVVTCGMFAWVVGVVGLIEGIIYLTKSDADFYNTYQVGKKPWF
jgi:TM2 domain-containing membrane protein YozV